MIVVARFRENLGWIKDYDRVFVVQKDEQIPNWGREPSSFLWYIIEHYDQLEGTYAFVQGNPFDHCFNFREKYLEGTTGFTWLGNEGYSSDATGLPFHQGLPVGKVAEALGIEVAFPIPFAAGGQFLVTAERVRQRPRWWYQQALETMQLSHMGEYCFERLWGEIFRELPK